MRLPCHWETLAESEVANAQKQMAPVAPGSHLRRGMVDRKYSPAGQGSLREWLTQLNMVPTVKMTTCKPIVPWSFFIPSAHGRRTPFLVLYGSTLRTQRVVEAVAETSPVTSHVASTENRALGPESYSFFFVKRSDIQEHFLWCTCTYITTR
ncbi:hypothetical protein BGW80DRAFT_443144 [Lactifluus volemus]|nr:hypothetical protein BGW80DRAFT_443144 [Lactifluus volemus]